MTNKRTSTWSLLISSLSRSSKLWFCWALPLRTSLSLIYSLSSFLYYKNKRQIYKNHFIYASRVVLTWMLKIERFSRTLSQTIRNTIKSKPIVTCWHAFYRAFLCVLIGSLDCLSLLWLAKIITLLLVLRYSIENCSNSHLLWFCITTPWLVKKTRVTFSTNQM